MTYSVLGLTEIVTVATFEILPFSTSSYVKESVPVKPFLRRVRERAVGVEGERAVCCGATRTEVNEPPSAEMSLAWTPGAATRSASC